MITATCAHCGHPFRYQPKRPEPRTECPGCNAERRIDGSRPVERTRIQFPSGERRDVRRVIEGWRTKCSMT